MTKENYTHLTLVVDRSGSMTSIVKDAQGGIDTLLNEQYALDLPFTLTLVQFDGFIETVASMASERPEYVLSPRGSTALFDAVGRAITETGESLRKLPEDERPSTVLFVVVTDGYENASHEFTGDDIKNLIDHQRDTYNWQFQFIGAGESAFQGKALGFDTTTYNPHNTGGTYAAASASITRSRTTGEALASAMPSEVN